jgi:hypothetical protein
MSATALSRTLLVMPAIEPSWESFLQVSSSSSPRAASLALLPCFLSRVSCPGHRTAVAVSVTAVVVAPACVGARSSARPRARASTHVRMLCGRKGRAFGSACPFAPSLPARSPRRRGLCRAVALAHTRAV